MKLVNQVINEQTLRTLFPHAHEEIYILLGIARNKYNRDIKGHLSDNAKGDGVVRVTVRTKEDWGRKLAKLKAVVNNYAYDNIRPEDFNMYVTINPRDTRKAYKILKQRFAEWDYNEEAAHFDRIHAEWLSALQCDEGRARKQYFMLDVDKKDDKVLRKIIDSLPGVADGAPDNVFVTYIETRNGYHVLLKPFDIHTWGLKHQALLKEGEVSICRDRLMFIGKGGDA